MFTGPDFIFNYYILSQSPRGKESNNGNKIELKLLITFDFMAILGLEFDERQWFEPTIQMNMDIFWFKVMF